MVELKCHTAKYTHINTLLVVNVKLILTPLLIRELMKVAIYRGDREGKMDTKLKPSESHCEEGYCANYCVNFCK